MRIQLREHRRALHLALALAWLVTLALPLRPAQSAETSPAATQDDEIIYIDSSGVIKVIDPNVPAGSQQIKWQSPDSGWLDIATGDFDNDGDQEIVAIASNKLTVFDPVYPNTAGDADGEIDLVPWKRLYEQPLPGVPNIIGAGNMDQNVAGDEIIVGFAVNEGAITYRLQVLKTTNGKGTAWTTHLDQGYGAPWKFVAVGNINNAGSDDVVLIRDVDYRVDAREVDNNLNLIFSRAGNSLFTYVHAAIGQMYAGGTGEVAIARTFQGTAESPSLLIYQFKNNQWLIEETDQNDDSLHFFPHPKFLFMADVNGNGDDELFWLRDVPSSASSPRLFMINRGSDTLPEFKADLDSDNGYKVGAAGDVDGDGKDEVLVMRNNRIRNFYAPETGDANLSTDYSNLSTNSKSLRVANLDGDGFSAGPRFQADPNPIDLELKAGTAFPSTIGVELKNVGSGGSIPFTASKVGTADWFTFSVGGTTTPATIFINSIDATNLTPGEYTGRIRITSTNTNVQNAPYDIVINLTVTPADFTVTPLSVGLISMSPFTATVTETVSIQGLSGLVYSAAILDMPSFSAARKALGQTPQFGYISPEGELVLRNSLGEEFSVALPAVSPSATGAKSWPSGVAWAGAASAGNTVPDSIVISGDPTQVSGSSAEAMLVIIADERAGDTAENAVFVPVRLLKAAGQIYLPYLRR